MFSKAHNFIFFIVCSIVFVAACSPERKLADKYKKHHVGNGVMIIPLYEIFKDNLTISFDTNKKYSSHQLDSIAWNQSCFIQHISDSVFLTKFTNSFIDELIATGFDVYVEEGYDSFLALADPKWVVQIGQMQLNENHKIEDRQYYSVMDGHMHYKSIRVNQVSQSTWLEVSRANAGNKQVLFLEGYIQDDFHLGVEIDLMKEDYGFLGVRDSIELIDVYTMAEESGQKHAELLVDYFMNDYIRENMPQGITNREYYHYNRRTNSIKKGLKERFDVVH